MNGIPNGGSKRFRNNTEFIFHFVKNQKELKFYMDRALKEPAKATSDRAKYQWSVKNHGIIKDGERVKEKTIDYGSQLTNGIRPDNVFRFHTAGLARDNHIKHPAPYHRQLPEYFINILTDEGDVVLDPFAGIGTTGLPCKDTNRQFIGYELNPKYVDFGNKRINGEELEEWLVCQYDLEDNLIQCFKNRDEASRATGVESGDIMRTYNRTKFESRGGYKWRLEKKQ
jgi:DNA modification methylase